MIVQSFVPQLLPACSAFADDVREAIYRTHAIDVPKGTIFFRAVVGRSTYYSLQYGRTTRNSYTVCYIDNGVEKFGFIRYFVCLQSTSLAVITPLTPTCNYCYPQTISVLCERVIPVVVQSSFVAMSVKCLLYKCVYIDFGSSKFIAKLPNQIYDD